MPEPPKFDVVLTGFRNDLARVRTLRHLDLSLEHDDDNELPRVLFSDLDQIAAEAVQRELSVLGAQVSVVPTGPITSTLATPVEPERRWKRSNGHGFLAFAALSVVLAIAWRNLRPIPHAPQVSEHAAAANRRQLANWVSHLPASADVRSVEVQSRLRGPEPRAIRLNDEALTLAQAKDFDGAVAKIREALRIAPGDPQLIKNLQALLVRVGAQFIGVQDYAQAIEYLEEAVRLGDQVEASYALGMAYLQKGDTTAAQPHLEHALQLVPEDGRILLALAELHLRLNQRRDALAYSQRARTSGVKDAALDERIAQLEREVDTEWDFVEHSSPHFNISFADNEDGAAVGAVLRALERAYQAVSSRLNYYPDERIAVVLYAQRDFHDVSQTPDWSGGAFDGRIKLPVRGLESDDDEQLARVVRHELTHAFIHEISGGRCPAWLHEGMAVSSEENEDGERQRWAEQQLDGHRPLPFAEISTSFRTLSAEEANVAYAQSYLAVRALVARYNARNLHDLLSALRTQSLNDAFSTVLRDDFALFEDKFLRQWS